MRSGSAAVMVGAIAWASCGGGQREPAARAGRAFDCRQRSASYVAANHLAGSELGVLVDCAGEGPRIQRWRMDKAGTRQEDAHSLTPGEFEAVWKEIEGTGWPNLRDCANGSGADEDPVYRFEISDDQQRAAFQCQAQAMPYPYNDIVDPLDLAAQRGRRQLGDDEPRDAKALDRKATRK